MAKFKSKFDFGQILYFIYNKDIFEKCEYCNTNRFKEVIWLLSDYINTIDAFEFREDLTVIKCGQSAINSSSIDKKINGVWFTSKELAQEECDRRNRENDCS